MCAEGGISVQLNGLRAFEPVLITVFNLSCKLFFSISVLSVHSILPSAENKYYPQSRVFHYGKIEQR
jgi:hypothetical protein